MPYARVFSPWSAPAEAGVPASAVRASATVATPRILFIDNVRWVMIVLVLGMHAAVTYSPLGSWYYRAHPPLGAAETLFFATFQGLLQGFFMALLFFVAGYFAASSYDAKGAEGFLKGRLYRLGLPTLLFVALIGPVTLCLVPGAWGGGHAGFLRETELYVTRGRFLGGTGPMWFCVALLIFCGGYAAWRASGIAPAATSARGGAIRPWQVAGAILALAAVTFLARARFPLGGAVFNLQLAYFPSYVLLFALGIMARRRDWITQTDDRFAWLAAGLCVGLALAAWLPLLILGGALTGHAAAFNGGLTWQSAGLSLWESLVCFGMTFGVLVGFRRWLAGQGRVSKFMSDNAFAVYVIHPPILVGLALFMSPLPLAAAAKFAVLWCLGAAVSFGLAAPLARRVPFVGRIL